MSEHFSTKQVELYLKREMAPAELLAADDHLAACTACREKLVHARQPEALLTSIRGALKAEARQAPKHLAYEQLAAYVDDEMGEVEREIVDSHLAVCAVCKEEMRDLFAFRETLSQAPGAASTVPASQTFLGRFLSSVRLAFRPGRLQLAGGLAALALIALGITLWIVWKSTANKPGSQEIVKTQPSPVMAETPAPPAPTPSALPQQEQQENANAVNPSPTPQRVAPPVNRAPRINAPELEKETVVALNDGGRRLTLDSQGHIEGLDNLSPSEQRAVREALLRGSVEASSELAGLGARADGTLMGAPGNSSPSFVLRGPVGVVVRTETPTFRWNALPGATEYTVKVFDSGFNKVMTSGPVSKTEWTAPRPLPRDGVYAWQVTALVEGKEIQAPLPPAPEARFRVLGRAQEEGLKRAEKLYARSHLTLGVLYSRAGLLDEAEKEFRALLAANPNSQVAQKLLRNIQVLKDKR
jgi:anti-sigma factor RsiW